MVYSRPPFEGAPACPTLELRPSSLTAVNKVSNIPFDRRTIALGEEAREKSPEKLFLGDVLSNLSHRSFCKKREEKIGKA